MIKTPHLAISSRGLLCSLGVISSALLLSGCQDENYGFESQEIRNSVYLRNFEKTYGKIAEDQIWDFSSYNLNKLGLEGGPTGDLGSATTRAQDGVYSVLTQKWYTVSSETSTWLSNNLKEKINNSGRVSAFEWIKEENDTRAFYIIPIYQGQTGMVWDLELLDNKSGNNYQSRRTIWSKSQNLKYTENYSKWEEFVYETGKDSPNNKTLKFAAPFSQFTDNTTEVAAAFAVSTDIKGSFYIKINDEDVKLTWDNAEKWLGKNGCNSGGTFRFTNAKNVSLNSNQEITPSSDLFAVNYVPFTELLNTTINEHKITRDDLKTLSFKIDDDQEPALNQAFYTWGDHRIQVFLHFNGVSHNEVTLSSISTNGNNSFVKCHTINRFNIQTHPIKIDMSKIQGTEFAFNLKTTDRTTGDNDLCEIGDDHRSDLGFMSQIDHFNGTVLNKTAFQQTMKNDFGITLANDFEIKVIGCEDAGANGKQSDNDYNDVVFLLVADKFPDQVIKKRYMIEDLGSTHDFDFNDIVVDVTETVSRLENGNKKYKQEAAIRHLCGTIPFRVKLGNKYFGYGDKEGAMMRGHNSGGHTYDPSARYSNDYTWTVERVISSDTDLASFRAEYWNPDANNITVEVWPTYASEDNNLSNIYWTDGENNKADNVGAKDYNVQARQIVEFPKVGKYPYIIATNQNVGWMEETVSIPQNWIKTKPSGYSNGFTPGQSTNDDGTSAPSSNHYEAPGNKTIWAGTPQVIDSYNNPLTFSNNADVITGLHVGDVLVISTKDVQTGASGAVRTGNWTTINGIPEVIPMNGDYTVTITQDILNAIQANGLLITGVKYTITAVSVRCNHSDTPAKQNYTLTLSCSDTDYDLYIDGTKQSSKQIASGTSVKVKAMIKDGITRNSNLYRFAWKNGNTYTYNSQAEEYTFTMPSNDLTITNTVLYAVQPIVAHPGSEGNTESDYQGKFSNNVFDATEGSLTITATEPYVFDQNRDKFYVPLLANFSASVSSKSGYQFTEWMYVNNDKTATTHQFQRPDNKNELQYLPQALFSAKATTTNCHVVVTAKPSGSGQVKIGDGNFGATAEGYYASGTNLTLYAQANNGYTFAHWSNLEVATQRGLDVKDAEHNVDAWFAKDVWIYNDGWGMPTNGNDFTALKNGSNNSSSNGLNALKDAIINSGMRTIVVYFNADLGQNASFEFTANYSKFSNNVKILKDRVYVTMTNDEALYNVAHNGFSLKISNNESEIKINRVGMY